MSISQLLSECEITKSFVYDLEKRDASPSADRLIKIADYLDCSVDFLLGRTENPEIHFKDSSIQIHDITNSGTQAIGNNIKLENIKDSEQLKSDITDQEYELIKMLREMPFENNFKCLQFIMGMYKEGKQ